VKAGSLFLFQHDINNAGHPFGFVAGRGVGHDFHPVDQVGGELAQAVGTERDQSGGFSVDEDAHIFAAAQADIALHIHRHGRHVVEDIGRGTAFVGQVFSDVEHPFVEAELHLAFFGADDHFVEGVRGGFERNGAQIALHSSVVQINAADKAGFVG
jgi:hypothetical protein